MKIGVHGAPPSYAPPVTFVAPNAAPFEVSDFAGTIEQNSTHIRLTRAIDSAIQGDTSNFRAAAPGARCPRFIITLPARGQFVLHFWYNAQVAFVGACPDIGSVLVNGRLHGDFHNPVPWAGFGNPQPSGFRDYPITLERGSYLIEGIYPYGVGLDYQGVTIPAAATISAPTPRPSLRFMFGGDSRFQGFNADLSRLSLTYLIAEALGAQEFNLAYGGRQVTPTDGAAMGAFGCDRMFYLCDFNDFTPGGNSLAVFQASYTAVLTGFRTASTTAGKPNAPAHPLTSFYSTSDVGQGGTFAGNIPTLEQFRQAERDAVIALADPHVAQMEGTGVGMPNAASMAGVTWDGIHYPNLQQAIQSGVIVGQI